MKFVVFDIKNKLDDKLIVLSDKLVWVIFK